MPWAVHGLVQWCPLVIEIVDSFVGERRSGLDPHDERVRCFVAEGWLLWGLDEHYLGASSVVIQEVLSTFANR